MHTRAAQSKSLHEHLLAYVKQHLPLANFPASLLVLMLLLVILSAYGCITLRSPTVSSGQSSLVVPQAVGGWLININTASAEQLEKLPGVGRVIAERIVAHREQYGPFRRAEHLVMVRGISDQKFCELRALIVVD